VLISVSVFVSIDFHLGRFRLGTVKSVIYTELVQFFP
jgi:hypothetical protein